MAIKKTLYQVLDIAANASTEAVRVAYEEKVRLLMAREAELSREDINYQRMLLDLALETLTDEFSRRAYDEKLMSRSSQSASRRDMALIESAQSDPEEVARKAERVALQAEALALRMEVSSLRGDVGERYESERPPSFLTRALSIFSTPLTRVVAAVATIVVLMIALQAFSFLFTVRKVDAVSTAASKARESAEIQDYYQRHGVRPASVSEARMLEEEQQRKQAQEYAEERERLRQEQEQKRFIEDSRREAERVSSSLRYAEEEARRDAEWKRRQQEQEELQRQADERERARERLYRLREQSRD